MKSKGARIRFINATAEFTADTRWKTGWKPSTNSTTRTIPRRREKIKSTNAQELRASPRPSGANENAARVGGVVCQNYCSPRRELRVSGKASLGRLVH